MKNYYYELDILRAIACLLVFSVHFPIYNFSAKFAFCGNTGVWLFFVISGFIITKSFGQQLTKIDNFSLKSWYEAFLTNKPKIYTFYYYRFLRLFPCLCLLFCCAAIACIRYGIREGNILETAIGFVNYFVKLIRIKMFYPQPGIESFMSFSLGLGVIWTLICEILFYLIFPLLSIFKKLKDFIPIILIIALIIKAILCSFIPLVNFYSMPLAYVDAFSMGMLVGFYHSQVSLNKYVTYFFTIIALWGIIVGEISEAWTYRHYVQTLLASAFLIYVTTLKKDIINVKLLGPLLHFIGVRAYFIYLMHHIVYFITKNPVKYLLDLFSQSLPSLKIFFSIPTNYFSIRHLISLIITILLADLFYRFVEVPFIKNNKNKWMQEQG